MGQTQNCICDENCGLPSAKKMYSKPRAKRASTDRSRKESKSGSHSRCITDLSMYEATKTDADAKNDQDMEQEQAMDGDAVASFDFGEVFDYWNENAKNRAYVLKTYDSLREEITNQKNDCFLNMQTYEHMLQKAKSIHRRMYDDHSLTEIYAKQKPYYNDLYGIACGSKMSVDHIMAIILYTDTTELQKYFKEHSRNMRPHGVDETYREIAVKNAAFANWFRLLYECVWIFGDELQFGTRVFHGVSCKLLFDSLQYDFRGPLSTTVDSDIANKFSNHGGGIILELTNGEHVGQPYFNAQVFSEFGEEREYLFYKATLKIVSIKVCDAEKGQWVNYQRYIDFLHLYYGLINGSYIAHAATKKQCKTTLSYIKTHIKTLEKRSEKGDDYISHLIENIIEKKQTIWINLRQIRFLETLHKKLANKFIVFDSDDDDAAFVVGEYLVTLMSKRPLVSLSFARQYEWTVDADELQGFISGEGSNPLSGWLDFWFDGDVHDDGKMCTFFAEMVIGNERFHAVANHDQPDDETENENEKVGLLWTYLAQNEAEYPSVMVDVEVYCPDIGFYVQFFDTKMKHDQRVGNLYLFPLKRITDHALKSFRWSVVLKCYPLST